jgi:ATP-dependent Zn protease
MMTKADRRRTAYHEAGHAVFIATALNGGWAKGKLGTVKIHKRGGHTMHTAGMKINDRISCLLMGAAASLHAAPKKTMYLRFIVNDEASQDFERAKELIAEYQPIVGTFKVQFETAERWVESLWDKITVVAEALFERGSLTGAQVRAMVRS